jgi:hypothetical protein
MKIKFHYIILGLLLATMGCKKDNYDAPASKLAGHLTYKGEAINVEYNQVPFEIYQPGFGKTGPIRGTFQQDGSYSTLLFNGNYKFTIPPNQGPFMWKELGSGKRDTLAIAVSGSQNLDIEVTPYYLIHNTKITGASKVVTAVFDLQKVITDANAKDIENVILYINKTQFVSAGDNQIASATLAGSAITSMTNVSMNIDVPTITPSQNYVFARVGLKVAGVEDLIFSSVVKVNY